jgi:thiamine-monophosphate kinase
MLSLGVPESLWKSDFVEMLLDSYSALAARESVELVGGDISRTPERLVIDSTVIGECPRGESVLRSGAQPGDAIYVTGSLGGARAGLALLERGGDGPGSAPLIARQLRPVPRTGVGRRLRELGLPSAMLDISDGLLGDLGHICSQSGVGAELDLTSVPIENGVAQAVGEGPVGSGRFEGLPQPLLTAVAGGEDFELLFTVPADRIASVPDQILGIPLTRIGSVTARGGIEAVGTGGGRVTLAPEGFDHFRGSDL